MKRSVFFLLINVVIGLYFTLMQFRLIPLTLISDVFNDLVGIPFLIMLMVATIISFRDFRETGFQKGIFSFLAFLTGLFAIVFLIFATIYPLNQTQ